METNRQELLMDWYEQYYDDIYRFILYMIGDDHCCEDLVHDTFVRAYMGSGTFEQRSSIKTWLFSIAKFVVIDEIRKRQRKKLFTFGLVPHNIADRVNLERQIEQRELILQLMRQIQELKTEYRLVVILKKIEECSTKEIADILNWSETKVRKTLSRALHSLRKMNGMEGGNTK
ncbi:RNA polymerase sigma factor [Bacillus rubiinfantis]|uniref:RNA polymerase sigma factor n=1 Tax=Bacillus rubiinfantis TaxID=1499680 RepID=UPI000B1320B1|nr:RNA polymerase sigma factor [Bacillus rubiinfantis]